MIDGSINLLSRTVLLQQSSENSLSSYPQDLGGHSAFKSSSTLSRACMSAESFGL